MLSVLHSFSFNLLSVFFVLYHLLDYLCFFMTLESSRDIKHTISNHVTIKPLLPKCNYLFLKGVNCVDSSSFEHSVPVLSKLVAS